MSAIGDALRAALERQPSHNPANQIPADWDDEGGVTKIEEARATPTKEPLNISRETFYFVRDNPGMTRQQIIEELSKRGHLGRTIGALLSTFLLQGMLNGSHAHGLYAASKEYAPPQSHAKFRKRQYDTTSPAALLRKTKRLAKALKEQRKKGVAVPLGKNTGGLQTLADEKAALYERQLSDKVEPPAVIKTVWSAQHALEGLSVLQARALYDELKKIFSN